MPCMSVQKPQQGRKVLVLLIWLIGVVSALRLFLGTGNSQAGTQTKMSLTKDQEALSRGQKNDRQQPLSRTPF